MEDTKANNQPKDDKKQIKVYKNIYPQVYSYSLPEVSELNGKEKIGYTDRKNVDDRIKEQTHTPAFHLTAERKWFGGANYKDLGTGKIKYFKDYDFHAFLDKKGFKKYQILDENNKEKLGNEWFDFTGKPGLSKELFEEYIKERSIESLKKGQKIAYSLRAEQEDAVDMTISYLNSPQGKEKPSFLWNAKPRFGKTLTTYEFIRRIGAKKVLITTNRPAIAKSWLEDYEKFMPSRYKFVSRARAVKNSGAISYEEYQAIEDENKALINFIGLQDLKGSNEWGGGHEKFKYVAQEEWDLVVIDEAHEAASTDIAKNMFDNIKTKFTLKLTGTAMKILANDEFGEGQVYNWTYADEQAAKQEELKRGKESGAHVDLPELRLFCYRISDLMNEKLRNGKELDNGDNVNFTISLNKFFAANDQGVFEYEGDVRKFLDHLTTNKNYPFSTPELREELAHTFWLVGNRVNSCVAMKKMLESHPAFSDYEIILAVGKGDEELLRTGKITDKTEKENKAALARVHKAIKESQKPNAKKTKTITLSIGQLTTGITVKEWSAVFMLNDLAQEDKYMQAIFRAQNPYSYVKDGQKIRKQNAYVFDFSVERILSRYDAFANNVYAKAATGQVSREVRKDNVGKLLNFMPVIAEDAEGIMMELEPNQVFEWKVVSQAESVVENGFRSSFLFDGVFTSVFSLPVAVRMSTNKMEQAPNTPKTNNEDTDETPKSDHEKNERTNRTRRISANKNVILGAGIYGKEVQNTTDEVLKNAKDLNLPDKKTVKELTERLMNEAVNPVVKTAKAQHNYKKDYLKQKTEEVKQLITSQAEDFVYTGIDNPTAYNNFIKRVSKIVEEEFLTDLAERWDDEDVQEKENDELTILKNKLKTFTSAVPSFILASDNPDELSLDNFHETVSPEQFSEIFTPIGADEPFTIEDFLIIRGPGEYEENGEIIHYEGAFNRDVFNQSIKQFNEKHKKLANYLDNPHKDIFSFVNPIKTNQIFTPRSVVNKMLNVLEQNNPNIFSNPAITFCDLHTKSGLYLAEVAKRLNEGLKTQIPDEEQRFRHIFEKQLYGFAPSEITYKIVHNYLYGPIKAKGYNIKTSNLKQLDLTEQFMKGQPLNMKFDVIIGNPPYQENDNGKREDGSANASARPIYHHFIEKAKQMSSIQSFIIPARWLSGAGKGLANFSKDMITDKHIKSLDLYIDSKEVFSGNDIKGGVCYFVRDESYNGEADITIHEQRGKEKKMTSYLDNTGTGEVFVPHPELLAILDKVKLKEPQLTMGENMQKIVSSLKPYGLRTDFFKNQAKYNLPETLSKTRQNADDLEIFGLVSGKRGSRFIPADYPLPRGEPLIKTWKVFVPKAYGCGAIGEVIPTPILGSPILGSPIQICLETFLQIGTFETKTEAEALLKYLKTKFFRAMVGVLKVTQDSPSRVYGFVPIQNFSSGDIDWSQPIAEIDRQLYAKYGLDAREIAFIEEKVAVME